VTTFRANPDGFKAPPLMTTLIYGRKEILELFLVTDNCNVITLTKSIFLKSVILSEEIRREIKRIVFELRRTYGTFLLNTIDSAKTFLEITLNEKER
jgi:predicted hydrocarbon binding protein